MLASVAAKNVQKRMSDIYISSNRHLSHPMWVLRTEFESSGRAASALTSELLLSEVMRLRNNLATLTEMSRASKACAPLDATELIYAEMKKDERV